MAQDDLTFWQIPVGCWDGETVVVLGGGESFTEEQARLVRLGKTVGRCCVVAINRAWERVPNADWLWGCDPARFWAWDAGPDRVRETDAHDFAGARIALWSPVHGKQERAALPGLAERGVKILRHAGAFAHQGLSDDPGACRGNNGAAQILSIVHHTGANRVLLVGVDMGGGHWHGGYVGRSGQPMFGHPAYEVGSGDLAAAMVYSAVLKQTVCLGRFADPRWAARVAQMYRSLLHGDALPPADVQAMGLLMIPNFVTFAVPLAERGVEVLDCSLDGALDCFRKVSLEDVL